MGTTLITSSGKAASPGDAADELQITTDYLPSGLVGRAYTVQLGALGGIAARSYTWNVAGGGLPEGLALNEGGLIGGKPTQTQKVDFDVTVTDGVGASATRPFQIVVTEEGKGQSASSAAADIEDSPLIRAAEARAVAAKEQGGYR